ncbi:hypothetical protein J7413_11595 [Shimia sp. R10_1]|uniref:DAPG hydrolase family protein n=1 Tax=Shimia sp. R10_1 TaxID=2821095 RepID=UPI001ADC3747|nr:hypothetical protein [Shimia sp. R10_1]MBO9474183.1 hypothetical protein [Shimia sp. R10_1]
MQEHTAFSEGAGQSHPLGWPSRQLKDAYTSIVQLQNGCLQLRVEHSTLKGVSAEMLDWWFSVFVSQRVSYRGDVKKAFLFWHPQDHVDIRVSDDKALRPLRVGDEFYVGEMFGGDPKLQSRERVWVSKRDNAGFHVCLKRAGVRIGSICYNFQDVPGGVDVVTEATLGFERGLAKTLLNNFIARLSFNMGMSDPWLLHNVQEFGYLQHFLPELFSKRAQGNVVTLEDRG